MRQQVVLLVLLILLSGCKASHDGPEVNTKNTAAHLYNYVRSLININSGLVSSRTNECYTTVYKNSLAALSFIHEGDSISAQGILGVFDEYYNKNASIFRGFPQNWDACTGYPTDTNYWEGDNAFLLLALNYYSSIYKYSAKYIQLKHGLVNWLFRRADYSNTIVSEGLGDMYAALKPYDNDSLSHVRLAKIRDNFYSGINFPQVLDHIVRAALVFCDTGGFKFLPGFIRTNTWAYDDTTKVTAYSAFQGEAYINMEISAQVLLTDEIFSKDDAISSEMLKSELSKVSLVSNNNPEITGLPYYVIVPGGINWNPATLPIADPSCYMLFSFWKFNPLAPGNKCSN